MSYAFVTAWDYSNKYISRKDVINYADGVAQHYKSVLGYKNGNYNYQQIDTTDDKSLAKFSFSAKKNNHDIIFGVIVLFIKNIRIDMLITLNEENFDNIPNKMECFFNSLEVTN